MFRKRRGYGKKRFVRKRAVRRVRGKKRVYRRRVPRAVSRVAETKKLVSQYNVSPLCLQNQSQVLSQNVFTLSPGGSTNGYTLGQGVGNAARIGNRVTTKKAVFKYMLNIKPYDSVYNPQPMPTVVKLFFFKSKLDPTFDLNITQIVGSPGSSAKLFEMGGGTTGLIGTIADLTHVISSDSFTYCTVRTHKIGYAASGGSTSNGVAVAASQYFSNNDFKLSVRGAVDVTKWMPKTVKWNDAGEVNTTWLFCLVQVVAADGSTLGYASKVLNMMAETQYSYIDL